MAEDGFPGFTPLSDNDNVYAFTAPKQTGPQDANAPSLVVLSTWADAKPRNILKYTAAYQGAYPSASILVIRNEVRDLFFRSNAQQQQRVAPAADFLWRHRQDHTDGRVLLHLLSNGGALQVLQTAATYRSKYGGALPVDALVLDCSPGEGADLKMGTDMLTMLLPPSVGPVARPVVQTLYYPFWWSAPIVGFKTVNIRIWEALQDPGMIGKHVPRVYIYSKADELIAWRDVVKHADAARKAGWPTSTVEIVDGKHVMLMLKDPKRYWAAITGVMQQSANNNTRGVRARL